MKHFALCLFMFFTNQVLAGQTPSSPRSEQAIESVTKSLLADLEKKGMTYGSPIFIRIFKQSSKLEVWIKKGAYFDLFKTYNICHFSGELGPKTMEGDLQSPEGFYYVAPSSLNPWSAYHLSFNLGYPNAYDRAKGYTGSALMVHGKCVSVGCYAMTDDYINEIYALAHAAFTHGQPFFRVHIFPFELEPHLLAAYRHSKWYDFWMNLRAGYRYFQNHKIPPNVTVVEGKYAFE